MVTPKICKYPFVYDSYRCGCACPRSSRNCPKGFQFNEKTCKCDCAIDPWCKEHEVFDRNKCACVCQRTCPAHYYLDATRCKCVCNRVCPAGHKRTADCNCVHVPCKKVITRCPSPFHQYNLKTCECGCLGPPTICKHPYTYDSYRCGCACPKSSINCPKGYQFNKKTCRCDCAVHPLCKEHEVFDRNKCACVCQRTCPAHYYLDATRCKCVCNRVCPAGYKRTIHCNCIPVHCKKVIKRCPSPFHHFNLKTCECGCLVHPTICKPPFEYSSYRCGCACPLSSRKCPKGYQFNEKTCRCDCAIDPWCKEHEVFDRNKCACVCQRTCPAHYYLDATRCKCVCNRVCPAGHKRTADCNCVHAPCKKVITRCPSPFHQYNLKTCECGCFGPPTICKHPYTYDSYRCGCACPKSSMNCPKGYQFNKKTCRCDCPVHPLCKEHEVFDRNKCACVCQRTCPAHYYLDATQCKCVCNRVCPAGHKRTIHCNCIPVHCKKVITKCPSPFHHFNLKTCECGCLVHPTICKPPFEYSSYRCGCACPLSSRKCPKGYQFNEKTCRCDCAIDPWCNKNEVFDRDRCVCLCKRMCPAPYSLDLNKCECVCNRVCPSGHRRTADCTCEPLTCKNAVGASECAHASCSGGKSCV